MRRSSRSWELLEAKAGSSAAGMATRASGDADDADAADARSFFAVQQRHSTSKNPGTHSTSIPPLQSLGLGGAPAPRTTDLHRFVKWPKYVRIQRQRRVLSMRLKVPPALNQFVTRTMDKSQVSG